MSPPASNAHSRRLRRWLLHGVLGGTLAAAAALALRRTDALRNSELQSYDLRMRGAATAHGDTNVVIVAIDEQSMQSLGPVLGRWPWPREAYQRVLDYATWAGAKQVVFDIAFPEADLRYPASDTAFAEALGVSGHAVLSMTVEAGSSERERRRAAADGDRSTEYVPRFAIPAGGGGVDLPDFARVSAPLPLFGTQAAGLGAIDYFPDPEDGTARSARLAYVHDGRVYPSLGLAAARAADPARFGGPISVDGDRLTVGRVTVPLHGRQMLVRWRGPFLDGKRETYSVIPFSYVVNSYEQQRVGDVPEVKPERLRGKTVFVAATAQGLSDLRVMPLGPKEPGVMLHASVLDNLLSGDWITRAPGWANAGFVILAALLAGSVVSLFGSVLAEAAAALAVLALTVVTAHVAFRAGVWLDLVAPLTGGALAAVGGMVANYMTEGRDKRRVREMFSRYVSPEYVRQLADGYRDLQLGGQRIPLTLLFSDIRGFTSISENHPPEVVVEVLNEYLARMSEVVFRHGGTLDKFIGDAVMAFWGAPVAVADHARRAADTALEMVQELERLNAGWEAEGRPIRIDIGIGLNTGEAIVGNIGSLGHKLDYTAIGDTVNLASRLEGLNKQYGTRVIVSEATRLALGGDYETRPLDEVKVKGKEQAVEIHELTGRRRASSPTAPAAPAARATAGAALMLLLASAGAAHGQKARWTDQVYQPGRWQGAQVAPLATTNAATDTLALLAQVDAYSQPPRWRAEIREVQAGRLGTPLVLIAENANVSVLSGVTTTPLREHRAAADPIAQAVIARFDAQGRPRDRGPARLVDRAADRRIVRVTLRRPAASNDFPDALLAMSRGRRTFNSLLRATAQQVGSNRSQEVVATAGARGLTPESKVRTAEGEITIRNDTVAVIAMEHRAVDPLRLDDFIRQGRLGTSMPVKEEQIP
jgi:adenylate cyclase